MSDPAIIDQAAVATLLEVTGGDREFLAELIDAYFTDSVQLLAAMQRSLATGDAAELRRAAHSLKSNSASFGAHHLADLCQELEERGKQATLAGAEALLPPLAAEYEAVRQALQAVASTGATP